MTLILYEYTKHNVFVNPCLNNLLNLAPLVKVLKPLFPQFFLHIRFLLLPLYYNVFLDKKGRESCIKNF